MWTETILVVWGHATPGVEGRSCRRGSGGSQKPGWMLWSQPGPPWRPGSWWGAAQMLLQTQEVGPHFLLQSCLPKSLPFILTEPPSGPRRRSWCLRGVVSPGHVPLGFPTDKSDLHAPDYCPDLIRTVGHERTFLVSSPVTHVVWVKRLQL